MNPHLAEVKADLDRAARKAEQARTAYNNAVKEWKAAKVRFERLELVEFDERLKLELARQAALEDGDAVLAALLSR